MVAAAPRPLTPSTGPAPVAGTVWAIVVAAGSGARYGGVLYVDSLSAAGGPVPTFLDLLKITVETIAKGFDR